MLENYYKQRKEKYIELIVQMFKLPDTFEKVQKLSKLLTDYSIFCYKHNLKEYDTRIYDNIDECYILPSEPEIYDLKNDATVEAVNNLKEKGSISETEAETLLEWSIGKSREVLAEGDLEKFKTSSLTGWCGYSQALTLIPFINIGIPVTINNVSNLPFAKYRHAFGTVELPILKKGEVIKKRYLLDATYRQFFTLVSNHEGRFYTTAAGFKDTVGPDAGYYTLKYPGGTEMAMELLKKGYIELDEHTAKLYGIGFICETLNIKNIDKMSELFKLKDELYLDSILNATEELDYSDEEINNLSNMVAFPNKELKRN